MLEQLNFNRSTEFLGRNGNFQCTGLDLYKNGNEVYLQPITSRGYVGRCRLEIPVEEIDNVIAALQRMK